jgi:hypothetical protein
MRDRLTLFTTGQQIIKPRELSVRKRSFAEGKNKVRAFPVTKPSKISASRRGLSLCESRFIA